LAPLFRMQARGLRQEMLKPGTVVAVEGYPSTQKQYEMRAERSPASRSSCADAPEMAHSTLADIIAAAFTALEQSSLGAAARGSAWLYPLANMSHVLGAALLVGAIVTFDVQVLRHAQNVGIIARAVTPVAAFWPRPAGRIGHGAAGGGRHAGGGQPGLPVQDGDVRPRPH
jgi:hypothetical protein